METSRDNKDGNLQGKREELTDETCRSKKDGNLQKKTIENCSGREWDWQVDKTI